MLCVAIKGPSYKEVEEQIAQALPYADLVELRLDLFSLLDFDALRKIRTKYSIPMIFTLRSASQGGNYKESEEKRIADLYQAAALLPDYVDLEYDVPANVVREIAVRYPSIKVILSYHHFSETPQNLDALYQTMLKTPAALYKIALTANSALDTMRMLVWTKKAGPNLIAISMGPHGQISRILAPIMGSRVTYASLEDGQQTAPGQLSAKILCERFRYHELSSQTAIYGLIGDPTEKSLSDISHNHLFASCGIDAVYVKIDVKPTEVGEFLRLAKQLPFSGISVTMPLKESVLPYLERLEEQAAEIGASNTLQLDADDFVGYNTDGLGALNAIEKVMPVKGKKVVILGAGGAAKAIIFEAKRRGGLVTILNRDAAKAKNLAQQMGCQAKGLDEMAVCGKEGYDILINCTPIEMPISEADIVNHSLVMDIKTRAKDTPLIQEAMKKGCRIVYGYRMFVEQAVGQFHIWFGDRIPPNCGDILEQKVRESLSFWLLKNPQALKNVQEGLQQSKEGKIRKRDS